MRIVMLLVLAALLGSTPAKADEGKLLVELNKFEAIDNGCRTFFLFRNRSDVTFQGFEMSLAILNTDGIIDRLLTVEAAPLPDAPP